MWRKRGTFTFISKHKVLLIVLFVALAAVALAGPVLATSHPQSAPPPTNIEDTESWLARLVTGISQVYIQLMGRILTLLTSILVFVSGYSDFVNSAVVVNGWVIVRDIANMFFIIVLLIIAFGTILGQEAYHYKKLLPKLLLMAVLVNFSRTIVGVMVDAAQVIMLTFVNGYQAAAGGNFANVFGIVDLLQFSRDECLKATGEASLTDREVMIASLLAAALVTVSVITVVVILAVLALRIVMLWFLTILSPIAFLAGTFPQGQDYYSQWWKEFRNQTVIGPILAFFLWLSLATVGAGNAASQISSSVGGSLSDKDFISASCTRVGSASSITSFILGTVMLLAGVQMAQEMGGSIAGAAAMGKTALRRGMKVGLGALGLGYKAFKPAAGYGVERLSAATGIEFRPSKWKEAYKEMRETSKAKRERAISSKAMQRLQSKHRLSRFAAIGGAPTDFLEKPGQFLRTAARGGPSEAKDRLLAAMRIRQEMKDQQSIGRGPENYRQMQQQDAQHYGVLRQGTAGTLTDYRKGEWMKVFRAMLSGIKDLGREERTAQSALTAGLNGLSGPDQDRAQTNIQAWDKTRDKTRGEIIARGQEDAKLENEQEKINMELDMDVAPLERQLQKSSDRKDELEAKTGARSDTENMELSRFTQETEQLTQAIAGRKAEHTQQYGSRIQEIDTRRKGIDSEIKIEMTEREQARTKLEAQLGAVSPDLAEKRRAVGGLEEERLEMELTNTKNEVHAEFGAKAVNADEDKRLVSILQKYRSREQEAKSTLTLDPEAFTKRWLDDRQKTLDVRIQLKAAAAGGRGAIDQKEMDEFKKLIAQRWSPAQVQEFDTASLEKKLEILKRAKILAGQTAT